jgi:hypothetical protein
MERAVAFHHLRPRGGDGIAPGDELSHGHAGGIAAVQAIQTVQQTQFAYGRVALGYVAEEEPETGESIGIQ